MIPERSRSGFMEASNGGVENSLAMAATNIEIYLQTFANKMFEYSKLQC